MIEFWFGVLSASICAHLYHEDKILDMQWDGLNRRIKTACEKANKFSRLEILLEKIIVYYRILHRLHYNGENPDREFNLTEQAYADAKSLLR